MYVFLVDINDSQGQGCLIVAAPNETAAAELATEACPKLTLHEPEKIGDALDGQKAEVTHNNWWLN